MEIKPFLKSLLKNSSLSMRFPYFDRPLHGDTQYEIWLIDRIDNAVAGKEKDNEISSLDKELFNNAGYLKTIPELAENRLRQQINEFNKTVDETINNIKTAPYNILSSLQWKDLGYIACRFGLFRVGYAFQKKASEYLYDKGINNKNIPEVCQLLTASIEAGDFETADYILRKRLSGWKSIVECVKHAHNSYKSLCDDNFRKRKSKKLFNDEDRLYNEYIKDKKIAIVGPAKTNDNHGQEIDNFDIIVRINYQGQTFVDSKTSGSRTDVSYYNGWMGQQLMKMTDKPFIRDLDYVVLKDTWYRFAIDTVKERSLIQQQNIIHFGIRLNMIPIAVMDLLLFDPAEIKIFNANFYLNETPYADGYNALADEGVRDSRNTFLKAMARHNNLSQICTIRNIRKLGLCKADNVLENILNMQDGQIMKKYEEFYPYQW